MNGLHTIATYIPTNSIDNLQQGKTFGVPESFIRSKVGAIRLPRLDEKQEASDLAVFALDRLLQKSSLTPDQIDALVVVTQNGDASGLPHTSAIVQSKFSLPNRIATFDVSLGCSGYIYALAIMKGFLAASGLKHGVIITADPYSKVIDPGDRTTTLLFGDAASATWIAPNADWQIAHPLYYTEGSSGHNLQVSDGKLRMNGWQIFNFAIQNVPISIANILSRENLSPEDIDCYCIHQGSAAIVEAIAKKFHSIKDRFMIDIQNTGNTVSSSIPILLEKAYFNQYNKILLCGFGVGLSIATTLIYKKV